MEFPQPADSISLDMFRVARRGVLDGRVSDPGRAARLLQSTSGGDLRIQPAGDAQAWIGARSGRSDRQGSRVGQSPSAPAGEIDSVEYIIRGIRKDGRGIFVESRSVRTTMEEKPAVMGSMVDITERKHLEEALRSLSLTDELTGLYNRRGFSTLAERHLSLARRKGQDLLLVLADIDGLKPINDTFGHAAGDQVVIDAGNVLKGYLPARRHHRAHRRRRVHGIPHRGRPRQRRDPDEPAAGEHREAQRALHAPVPALDERRHRPHQPGGLPERAAPAGGGGS